MNRIIGIATAILLGLFVLLPVAAAAEPWDHADHIIISTGGDITLPAGHHVDLLVVNDGAATILGDADGVVVVNGSAAFVGSTASGIVAVSSTVTLDSATTISGDIRTFESSVVQAPGSVVQGQIVEGADGVDWPGTAAVLASVAILIYLGFYVLAAATGLVAAGVASRQLRAAGALIQGEPGATIVAGLAGSIGVVLAAFLAMVTIVGIPLGIAILIGVLPVLAFAGYLVAGVWLGDQILARLTPTVTRERPYLAAVVGLAVLQLVSIVPFIGGVVAFLGFGAVVLLLWRTFRATPETGAVEATGMAGAVS